MHIHIHLNGFPRNGFPRTEETLNAQALTAEYAGSLEKMVQDAMQLAQRLALECQQLEGADLRALERQISFGRPPVTTPRPDLGLQGFFSSKGYLN